MECQTVHEHLSAYLDRDLPQPMRELLEHHFTHCPPCQFTLSQLQTVTAWVREFPPVEPSPLFLQQVTNRVDHLTKRSTPLLFHRLVGAFPVQVAAVIALLVSAAVLWQNASDVWQGQQAHPPALTEPWLSRDRTKTPAMDVPAFEPFFDESPSAPAPLVQAPLLRPVLSAREEPLPAVRDVSAMPTRVGLLAEGRAGELALFPSFVLRASDPVRVAQQVWEIVPRLGGALLQAQGMVTPAGLAARGPAQVAITVAAHRYQALLDAIQQLPDTSLVEERLGVAGRELSPGSAVAFRPFEYAPAATPSHMTLIITILPR
jgi:hypothetical protein